MDNIEISKYISLILRHKPELIGIKLDSHGWADVNELIVGVRLEYSDFNKEQLELIVQNDKKRRYTFDETKTKIRANQGHSVCVDLDLLPIAPPDILYHGTGEKYVRFIDTEGLIRKSRQYVHLSDDIETAKKVGMRHGRPVIYIVESAKMYLAGYKFYKSENDVWLTDKVPIQYLRKTV